MLPAPLLKSLSMLRVLSLRVRPRLLSPLVNPRPLSPLTNLRLLSALPNSAPDNILFDSIKSLLLPLLPPTPPPPPTPPFTLADSRRMRPANSVATSLIRLVSSGLSPSAPREPQDEEALEGGPDGTPEEEEEEKECE